MYTTVQDETVADGSSVLTNTKVILRPTKDSLEQSPPASLVLLEPARSAEPPIKFGILQQSPSELCDWKNELQCFRPLQRRPIDGG